MAGPVGRCVPVLDCVGVIVSELVGVLLGVPDAEVVKEGVFEGLGVIDGVPELVTVDVIVTVIVLVGEGVIAAVTLGVWPDVCVTV